MSELALISAIQIVLTLAQACLLVVVLRKAGYGPGIAALGLAPGSLSAGAGCLGGRAIGILREVRLEWRERDWKRWRRV